MKPLKLIMQAFGPYGGKEVIDFTQLENRTMFVISGKTGSGKTTIFDAISYAIYGKASGDERNGPDLRSQFADEGLLTEITLDFSLRNTIYSIKRSPQQQKKKERGDGYTAIGAKGELYVWEENGRKKLIAAKINEVDEKIKEIMQIDSNQFRQIMMIPQGDFRKLLISDSKDKEMILQRLFHTQIYKLIEEKLKLKASDLKQSVEEHLNTRNEEINRIQPVFNEELKKLLEENNVNDTVILPLLAEEISRMKDYLETQNEQLKKKEQQRDKINEQLFQAEGILKQFQLKEEIHKKKDFLDGQRDMFTEKEMKIRLAQKAAILAAQEELCHRLKREKDQLEQEALTITKETESLNTLTKKFEAIYENELNQESKRQLVQEEMNWLQNIKQDVYSFATLTNETNRLSAKLKEIEEKQKFAEKQLELKEEQHKSLVTQKGEIEQGRLKFVENQGYLEKIDIEVEKFKKIEKVNKQFQDAKEKLKQVEALYKKSIIRYEEALKQVQKKEHEWLTGQASVLAATLIKGEQCPVCGSTHHPSPAGFHEGELPNEMELKSLKEETIKLEKEKSKIESNFYEYQSSEKSLDQMLQELILDIQSIRPQFKLEDCSVLKANILTEKEKLVQEQKGLQNLILQLEEIHSEIKKVELDISGLKVSIQNTHSELHQLTVLFTEKNTILIRMKDQIPENLRTEAEYEKEFAKTKAAHETMLKCLDDAKNQLDDAKKRYVAAFARLTDAKKHFQTKQNELTEERTSFLLRLKEQGFDHFTLYNDSKLSEIEMDQLENEIRSYREELKSVTDRFLELTEQLKDVKIPQIELIQSQLLQTTDEIESLTNERTELLLKSRVNEEILERINHLNNQIKKFEEKYKLIGHLYDVARGQNTYRITFERFVLAAFLDDILEVANLRLKKMTAGRYLLLRKTDRSKGNIQSGLELLVFDQYTGQERHVKTLSGGESFKASLSLALGLADVVQNYAGGVSLETMFIDEGFGTLDPESLDQAIEALMDIQSSGRLVGIISHVPELKERIDARLEVSADQTGSKTEFVFSN